jgi:hypothetical protein
MGELPRILLLGSSGSLRVTSSPPTREAIVPVLPG